MAYLAQDFSISTADALEILQSCTKPSIFFFKQKIGRLLVDWFTQSKIYSLLPLDLAWGHRSGQPCWCLFQSENSQVGWVNKGDLQVQQVQVQVQVQELELELEGRSCQFYIQGFHGCTSPPGVNTFRTRQSGCHFVFAVIIFNLILLYRNFCFDSNFTEICSHGSN